MLVVAICLWPSQRCDHGHVVACVQKKHDGGEAECVHGDVFCLKRWTVGGGDDDVAGEVNRPAR